MKTPQLLNFCLSVGVHFTPASILLFLCTFLLHSPLIRPHAHGFWQGAAAVDDDLASCEVAGFVTS